jgi:quercetin dioxygenase-like cupin family protein
MPIALEFGHLIATMQEQDEVVEFVDEVCGFYFRSVLIKRKGKRVPQHVHDYDHATLVCQGRAALYVGGAMAGIYEAGKAVPILAGQHHEFEALEDNTRLTCVHDVASAQSIKEKGL